MMADTHGEGLVGLTRGFIYAGARRVLASLWQVNDVATAELMKHFYRGLLKPAPGQPSLTPAAALRAAQSEMRRQPRWRAPYYWAAFTLQGPVKNRRDTYCRTVGAGLESQLMRGSLRRQPLVFRLNSFLLLSGHFSR